jgi:hypothetical protein
MAETFGLIPQRKRVKQLVRNYKRLRSQLRDVVYSINITNYTDAKAGKAQRKTRVMIKSFNETVYDWMNVSINSAYREAERQTRKTLKKMNRERKRDIDHNKEIENSIDEATYIFLRANNSILKQTKIYLSLVKDAQTGFMGLQEFDPEKFENEIDNIIADAQIYKQVYTKSGHPYMANKSVGQAKKLIMEKFKDQFGELNFIAIEGKDGITRNYQLDYYAEMVARTEMRKAQTNAVVNVSKEWGQDLVRFSNHDKPCRICAPLERQIFSISGNHPRYEPLSGNAPPIHPHCEHNIDPYHESLSKQKPLTTKQRLSDIAIRYKISPNINKAGLNTILGTVEKINKKFGMKDKIRIFGNDRAVGRNLAAYFPGIDGVLFQVKIANKKIMESIWGNANKALNKNIWDKNYIETQLKKLKNEKALNIFKKYGKQTPYSAANTTSDTITHELGHRLWHKKLSKSDIDIIKNEFDDGWRYLIGRYSWRKPNEFFAESFVLYNQGKKHLLSPKIKKIIESYVEQ